MAATPMTAIAATAETAIAPRAAGTTMGSPQPTRGPTAPILVTRRMAAARSPAVRPGAAAKGPAATASARARARAPDRDHRERDRLATARRGGTTPAEA